jgi:hypothetical protein
MSNKLVTFVRARLAGIRPGVRAPKPDRTIEIPGHEPGEPAGTLEFDRPITEDEYEAIKARWLKRHGRR